MVMTMSQMKTMFVVIPVAKVQYVEHFVYELFDAAVVAVGEAGVVVVVNLLNQWQLPSIVAGAAVERAALKFDEMLPVAV